MYATIGLYVLCVCGGSNVFPCPSQAEIMCKYSVNNFTFFRMLHLDIL
jgi:hypothetical protein